MAERILVPVRKFERLLDYMESIGLDVEAMSASARLTRAHIRSLGKNGTLPGSDYSCMYREAVRQMQLLKRPIPWAAGMGSEAFELMCHCIIGAKTLGDALSMAQRFDNLVYPMVGYRVATERDEEVFRLSYHVRPQAVDSVFVPEDWEWGEHYETVSQASGLMVWYSFCGWLVGRSLDLEAVHIAGLQVSDAYQEGLSSVFQCPIEFDTEDNILVAAAEYLEHRIVQNTDTLAEFLRNAVHELISINAKPTSTTAAIRSLIKVEFGEGIPTFERMSELLHTSESSLRRRLLKEDTSYQRIKDEVRCDIAVERLRDGQMKIHDLADYLGFTEPSSFVRSFRGWMGMTPKEYRDRQCLMA